MAKPKAAAKVVATKPKAKASAKPKAIEDGAPKMTAKPKAKAAAANPKPKAAAPKPKADAPKALGAPKPKADAPKSTRNRIADFCNLLYRRGRCPLFLRY